MRQDENIPSYEMNADEKLRYMAHIGRQLGALKRQLRTIDDEAKLECWLKRLTEIIESSWNSDLELMLDECTDGLGTLDTLEAKKKQSARHIDKMRQYVEQFKNQIAFQRDEYRRVANGVTPLILGGGVLCDNELVFEDRRVKLSPVSYKIAVKLAQNGRISYGEITSISSSRTERRETSPTPKSRMSKLKGELRGILGADPFTNIRSEECYKLSNN